MAAFHVERSIVIAAPPERVFDTVVDFGSWTTWLPWLRIDRQAEVTVTDDPRSEHSIYRWAGEVAGAGEIEHMRLERPHAIDDQIRFLKPYKSQSEVTFRLAAEDNGTKITWHMQGKLPWFMFWMRSKMEGFVGMDYQRGLQMLREYIETGSVLSQIDVKGAQGVEPIDVYGVREQCRTDEIGPAMEKAIAKVTSILSENGISTDGDMISVYHPCDLNQGFDFTTGFSVDRADEAPAGINHCPLPGGQSLHLRHTGSYENLGNAWSGAYQYARYKKLKIARQDGYEIYRNDPNNTPQAEWVTDVYLPLK